MPSLHYSLIEQNQRFNLLATYLDSHKNHKTLVLFSTEPQIQFFESVFTNLLPKVTLNFALVDSSTLDFEDYQQVVLMDIPNKFETISSIINSLGESSKLILFVFKNNKGYIKRVSKKLGLEFGELNFNPHKFLMIQDKFLELVDSNYAINRQAFYAYGSFLQYFNNHLLKRVFRTDRLNVKNVGLGFGMAIPPKVNLEAKFLTQKAQLKEKTIKRKLKLERVKERVKQQKQEQEQLKKQEKLNNLKSLIKSNTNRVQEQEIPVEKVKAIKTKKIQKVKKSKINA